MLQYGHVLQSIAEMLSYEALLPLALHAEPCQGDREVHMVQPTAITCPT